MLGRRLVLRRYCNTGERVEAVEARRSVWVKAGLKASSAAGEAVCADVRRETGIRERRLLAREAEERVGLFRRGRAFKLTLRTDRRGLIS